MADRAADGRPWTGSVVLFLQSPNVDLNTLFKDQQRKFNVFKVIKLTLIDSAGGLGGCEILKVHDCDPLLGVEMKFIEVSACQHFLESYSSEAVHQSLSQHACRLLTPSEEFTVKTQLKAGNHVLDNCLDDLDLCLHHVHCSKPARLRDEEIDRLEGLLRLDVMGPAAQVAPLVQQESPLPSNSFRFQNRIFGDRTLSQTDIQNFSTGVGRDWKLVGRALEKTCRALKDPAIDNLAYEYEKDGLYEQAYQLLTRFVQAEGSAAKLSRLVKALEDCKLKGLAENILGIHSQE
ncbi:tumor necrosis factor receptor type 1-associated DEATH domain protein [Synchiropus splendidus]|uniref:tumor necrosis factor receptor type 1-associated DEATH domain protein n=1 Tax=Synchiropus splendidus TaxID=270530 RepID=UPI00237DD801|nr:tumor necrosis factor receptor type 1-associated DEATH domain protein [Synchiropus splendidus]